MASRFDSVFPALLGAPTDGIILLRHSSVGRFRSLLSIVSRLGPVASPRGGVDFAENVLHVLLLEFFEGSISFLLLHGFRLE